MATIHLKATTTSTPEQFVAAAWGGASGLIYTFTRRPDGTTEVDEVVVREGKNLKGRATGIVLGVFGKRVVGKALENTVKAIEARNNGTG